jgi:NADPH:quinone reductase-like Zn-dependent oxidoreductase
MRAVIQTGFGGPEVLALAERPDPQAGPVDVIVRVRACALNRLDLIQQRGPAVIPGFRLPHIAGMDIAGVVVEVGREVTRLAVDDAVVIDPAVGCGACPSCRRGEGGCRQLRIIGGNTDGGLAEYVRVPAHAVHLVPAGLDLVDAALLPSAWATAWHAVHGVGRVTVDDQVLVHAAASAVSIAAVQLLHQAGARVIAVAGSPAKRALAAELGADLVLDPTDGDTALTAAVLAATGGIGVDLVLDHVGSATWEQSLAALRIGGRLVTLGNTSGDVVSLSLSSLFHRGVSVIGAGAYTPAEFEAVLSGFVEHQLQVVRAGVFPLAAAAQALQRLASRDLIGKLVIEP